MKVTIIGAGRAGGSLALAAAAAGHHIAAVVSRHGETRFGPCLAPGDPVPACDLVLLAVRDGEIESVAEGLAAAEPLYPVAAHLSGYTPVTALSSLAAHGVATGGLHPLQTFPDPDRGALAIAGCHAGIGGDDRAVDVLTRFAGSLGMRPFRLADADRPAYHAGAAASSNFVVTALATAADLFRAAGVEPDVMRPLVEQVVANALTSDPAGALTGPIARGDVETVVGHLQAAHRVSKDVGRQFRLMAEATAVRAGRHEETGSWR